jgi:hypothetical protein
MDLSGIENSKLKGKETWKNVVGYDGRYMVSSHGRVLSVARTRRRESKLLKPRFNGRGYLCVAIYLEGKRKDITIHKLMSLAFFNIDTNGKDTVVDHIDDDKTNNHISNLRVISQRENSTKSGRGESKYIGVTYCYWTNRWVARITIDRKEVFLGRFKNEKDAGMAYINKRAELDLIKGNV